MKGKMLVLVAIVLGVIVVLVVNSRFTTLEAQANPKTKTVYKAVADLQPGSTVNAALEESHLLQPVSDVPESFANSNPDLVDTEIEWVKKMTITRAIRAGDFLRMSHLQALSSAEVSASIPEGKRLYTVKVDQVTSVGFLVAPGDLVDVYAIWTRPDATQPGGIAVETPLISGDVLVFAVDASMISGDGALTRQRGTPYTSVTFALTTEELEKVLAAAQRGKLSLSLKSKKVG